MMFYSVIALRQWHILGGGGLTPHREKNQAPPPISGIIPELRPQYFLAIALCSFCMPYDL